MLHSAVVIVNILVVGCFSGKTNDFNYLANNVSSNFFNFFNYRILYTHLSRNMRPGIIVLESEVFVFEVEEVFYVGVELHYRQRARGARELQVNLLKMVKIYVCVAGGVDKLARL